MIDPAYDVAVYLEAQNIARRNATSGWLLVVGALAASTLPQVACIGTGGYAPAWSHDEGQAVYRSTVQVLVLGNAGDYITAREKAEAIFAALKDKRNLVMNGRLYLLVEPAQSQPVWLGWREKDNRPMWSQNFVLTHE